MTGERVQFETIIIPATAFRNGIPLGIGKCKGVILQLNTLALNTTTAAQIAANQRVLYYGDATRQQMELVGAPDSLLARSPFIPCGDLSDIWVRGNGVANTLQVMIFHGENENDCGCHE